MAWRGLGLDEASGDLLALVILAGTAATGYRIDRHTANRRMITLAVVSLVAAAAVGLVQAVVLGSGA